VLCFFRWQAWFGNPIEPEYKSDTIVYEFPTFGWDSVPKFVQTADGWQDMNEPQVLRLVVLGDVHNMLDKEDYKSIYNRHANIDAYAQLGDWMERGYFYYEQQLLHQLVGSGMDQLPVVATPGNHEYKKGIKRTLPSLWLQTFQNPLNGPARFLGSTYYVDFPRLRLIAIDTQGLQRLSDFTITMTWLKKVMQTKGNRFTIVIMHHPVYSSGKGRFNVGTWLFFHPILAQADVVFAGHDHSYATVDQYINTNSSRKVYHAKKKATVDAAANSRLYEVVEISGDTLYVSTYSLDSLDYIQTFEFAPLVQDSTAIAQ